MQEVGWPLASILFYEPQDDHVVSYEDPVTNQLETPEAIEVKELGDPMPPSAVPKLESLTELAKLAFPTTKEERAKAEERKIHRGAAVKKTVRKATKKAAKKAAAKRAPAKKAAKRAPAKRAAKKAVRRRTGSPSQEQRLFLQPRACSSGCLVQLVLILLLILSGFGQYCLFLIRCMISGAQRSVEEACCLRFGLWRFSGRRRRTRPFIGSLGALIVRLCWAYGGICLAWSSIGNAKLRKRLISLGARCRLKRKGDFSREKSPSLSDFLKLWFGFQITTESFRNRS